MSLAQISKKIEQVETQFILQGEKEIETVQQANKREGALRVAIQSLSTWIAQVRKLAGTEDELYLRAVATKEQLKLKMQQVSQIILDSINREYMTSFSLLEIIGEKEWYYYQFGILQMIQESGVIRDLFQKLLADTIPPHPKDEYPLARSMNRCFIVHTGPTNSGKTHQALEALKKCGKGLYLSPLRLLALEIYERLNGEGVPCDLLTGEEVIFSSGARHVSSTIEKADYDTIYDVAVIDEGQMIGDPQRGYAWTRAVLGIRAHEIHICCAAEAVPLLKRLIDDCGDALQIQVHERQTPLIVQDESFYFPRDVRKGDALIVFSRKKALQVGADLAQYQITSSIIYGNLPPETRRKQVDLFLNKETDVVVSTDAIGMGLNLPIQRVVFLETEKFDGTGIRELTAQEVKQIAGRAGRKGIYEQGFVNTSRGKANLRSKLAARDTPLEFAYIAPHDSTILGLPFGSLLERLKAWNQYAMQVPYFRKADISEILELLELAKHYEAVLPSHILYNAVMIPFNYQEKELLSQWFLYLDCLKINRTRLPKPRRRGSHLSALETYYRAIGLYYSFSHHFGLPYDWRWVKKERQNTSEEIHQSLKSQMQVLQLT